MRAAIVLFLIASTSRAEYIISLEVQNSPVNTIPDINDWPVSITADQAVFILGPCPAGFYCPGDTPDPLPCALGTYSPEQGRNSSCDQACPANSYCPDPASVFPCPQYTSSPPNSSSKLYCACDMGYVCTYTKQTQVQVVLHMPLEAWLDNQTLQQILVQAVAVAASVPAAKVQIDSTLPAQGPLRRSLFALFQAASPPQRFHVTLNVDHHQPVPPRALAHQLRRIKDTLSVVAHTTKLVDHIHTRRKIHKSFLTV